MQVYGFRIRTLHLPVIFFKEEIKSIKTEKNFAKIYIITKS